MIRVRTRLRAVALLAAIAAGCAENPITGRSQFPVVSELILCFTGAILDA